MVTLVTANDDTEEEWEDGENRTARVKLEIPPNAVMVNRECVREVYDIKGLRVERSRRDRDIECGKDDQHDDGSSNENECENGNLSGDSRRSLRKTDSGSTDDYY